MVENHHIIDVLVLLLASVVAVPLSQKLHMGPVLGYLVAGVVVGPSGFGLVADIESIHALAELGVVFLLFTIGLEMTLDRLKRIGLPVLGLGVSQIAVTVLVVSSIVLLAGYPLAAAVMVGGALTMSSTAIVLQVLNERSQLKTRYGQVALAVLLLQDLAVSPFLVLLEVLENDGGALTAAVWPALGLAALKAAGAIGVIFIVGRVLLRPLLRLVCEARSSEVFAASTLLVALGTSWATEHVGLSMAFGAFLAGMLIAETEYRHQVQADIEPFRGILLGLFFTTVGMRFDLSLALENIWLVMGLTLALLLGKSALIMVLSRLFRFTIWRSMRLGGVLSQAGEFAFVLLGMAVLGGAVPAELGHLMFLVVAASMAATPFYITVGSRWVTMLESRETVRQARLDSRDEQKNRSHVLIVGFGEVGRIVARMLKAYGLPYLVLEMSPRRINEGLALAEPVFYGDASLVSVLKAAGAEQSRAVVVATGDSSVTLRVVEAVRSSFTTLPIFARVSDEASAAALRSAGITDVVPETMEVGLRLASAVLHDDRHGSEDDIRDWVG
ncbi:MAG: kefB [Rhodospirillaceae bacterium]|nr:MAG: kefB [Rhodospirillaceae bacterium]